MKTQVKAKIYDFIFLCFQSLIFSLLSYLKIVCAIHKVFRILNYDLINHWFFLKILATTFQLSLSFLNFIFQSFSKHFDFSDSLKLSNSN